MLAYPMHVLLPEEIQRRRAESRTVDYFQHAPGVDDTLADGIMNLSQTRHHLKSAPPFIMTDPSYWQTLSANHEQLRMLQLRETMSRALQLFLNSTGYPLVV